MMTRAASTAVLQYILTDVLGQAADGPLHKALKQDFIETIQDMKRLLTKTFTIRILKVTWFVFTVETVDTVDLSKP